MNKILKTVLLAALAILCLVATVACKPSHKVAFVVDGKIISTDRCDDITQLEMPQVPSKVGYTGSWKNAVLQNDGSFVVEADYTPVQYTITYQDTFGVQNNNAETFTVESSFELQPLFRSSFNFDGWFDADGNKVERVQPGTAENLVLVAHWSEKSYVYNGESVTVTVYTNWSNAQLDIAEKSLQSFNEMYPQITVEIKNVGPTTNMVPAVLEGDYSAAVAVCYAEQIAQLRLKNLVAELDGYISENAQNSSQQRTGLTTAQIDDFFDSYYNACKDVATNKMFALPFSATTEFLYYNKTVLDELNLQPATTWDELWEQCQFIKEKYPSSTPFVCNSSSILFLDVCQQNNWGYVSLGQQVELLFNNNSVKAWATSLREKFNNGLLLLGGPTYVDGLFSQGTKGAIYCLGVSSMATYYASMSNGAFEIGIAPVPQSNSTAQQLASEEQICVLNSNSTDTASWLVAKFFATNVDFKADYSVQGNKLPVTSTSATEALNKCANSGENVKAVSMTMGLLLSESYFTVPAFPNNVQINTIIGDALYATVTGEKTADEAFADAYNQCLELLNQTE